MSEVAVAEHEVWSETSPELMPHDFNYPYRMAPDFLRRLIRARRASRVPFRVVSDHRPPARNVAAGGAQTSAHMESPCRAVDLRVNTNEERYRLLLHLIAGDALEALREVQSYAHLLPPEVGERVRRAIERPGFRRIGIYPPTADQVARFGQGAGSVHADDSPTNPSPRVWVQF